MKLLTEPMQKGMSFAYISLLMEMTNVFTSPISPTLGMVDEDLGLVLEDSQKIFLSLEDLLGADEDTRSQSIKDMQAHEKVLENKFKIINAYSRELAHIASLLENQYHIKTIDLKDIEGINYHQFVHEGLDFIESSKDDQEKAEKIKEFLRLLPMRMTRESFIDYIKHSLEQVATNPLGDDNSLFLSVFKQMFDGRSAENYGLAFDDLSMAIEEIRDLSDEELTTDQIEGVFDDIYLLQDTLEGLNQIISTLHNAFSYLSGLLILDHLTFDLLTSQHVSFNDLFFTIKSLVTGQTQGEDYAIIMETLPDRLSDVYDEIDEDYSKSRAKLLASLKKEESQGDDNLQSIKIFNLLQFYLMRHIEDAFSFGQTSDPASQLPADLVQEATDFLQEQLNSLKPAERKLRMQHLISLLPFTMDTQEFATYFDHALEGTSSEAQKSYVLAKLSDFMDSLGYFDQADHQHS